MNILVKLRKLKFNFLLKNMNPQNEDKIQEMILDSLNPVNFNKRNLLVTSKWEFNCIFYTLRDYNKTLMRITTLLKNNVMISSDWCSYHYIKVTYDEFFTDQYYYVDKVKEVEEFIRLVRILRSEYSKIKDTSIGIAGHNSRQSKRLNAHINDLIVEMVKVSNEISLHKSGWI